MPFATRYNLPVDFVAFLESHLGLNYSFARCEAGEIEFFELSELRGRYIRVEYQDDHFDLGDDYTPGEERYGSYHAVPVVPLLKQAETITPSGVLVWYPQYLEFGQYNSNHFRAYRFAGATWKDICDNPEVFLDAKWRMTLPCLEGIRPWCDKTPTSHIVRLAPGEGRYHFQPEGEF